MCNCKNFCETHGRDYVEIHEGQEICAECSADGFGGELCTPMPESCSLGFGADKANRWERQFMCWRHAIKHWWFCLSFGKDQ